MSNLMDKIPDDTFYISIDPGEVRIGYACFDDGGQTVGFGVVKGMDEFIDFLEAGPQPREIIFENYRLLPGKNKSFSKVRTIECIGLIKRHCYKNKITLHEQRNTDLSIGLRYLGLYGNYYNRGKNIKHVEDQISALAHGVYFLTKNKIRPHRLEAK